MDQTEGNGLYGIWCKLCELMNIFSLICAKISTIVNNNQTLCDKVAAVVGDPDAECPACPEDLGAANEAAITEAEADTEAAVATTAAVKASATAIRLALKGEARKGEDEVVKEPATAPEAAAERGGSL